ncbi:MAG: hypothetical protein IPN69_05220 [Acidobacteria bacterium]|nr:hypothetical protein [Acidobacteriota bacterium]
MSQETNNPSVESSGSSDGRPIPELDRYIFDADPYTSGVVPRKLQAAEVARYLIRKVKKDIALKSVVRVEDVARFYETSEIVGDFKQFLDGKESGDDDQRRSIVFARIIAYLGNAEDLAFATRYYKYLSGKAQSVQVFEELTLLHEALGLGEGSTELKQKFESRALELSAKKETDFQARIDYNKFSEDLAQKIFRASRVQSIKDRVLGMSDRKQRIGEEIKMYLSLEYGFLEFLQPWATGRLRRETWGAQPADQSVRAEKPELKQELVEEFRKFLENMKSIPEIEPEDEQSIQLRLLRAIKFFDGKLSDAEEGILRINKGKQLDLLANEGFGL